MLNYLNPTCDLPRLKSYRASLACFEAQSRQKSFTMGDARGHSPVFSCKGIRTHLLVIQLRAHPSLVSRVLDLQPRTGRTYIGSSPATTRCPQAQVHRRGGTSPRRHRPQENTARIVELLEAQAAGTSTRSEARIQLGL
jgi:hypothetical protein